MVYWENTNGEVIEFTVMVPNVSKDPNFDISMVKIWNYNRSLNVSINFFCHFMHY